MSTSKKSRKSKKSKKHVRCIVRNCQNHTDEGRFVGPMCSPCYHFVAEGVDIAGESQAFRNALEYVWPRIKRHLGRRLKTFFLDFEENPHQLADRLFGASLADRMLADVVAFDVLAGSSLAGGPRECSRHDRSHTDMMTSCQKTKERGNEMPASRGPDSPLRRAGSGPARKTSR